jgi:hypothetical protein
MGRKRGTLTAPGTCPLLNSSGGRTSRTRAPPLLPEEEEEEGEGEGEEGAPGGAGEEEKGRRGSDARSEGSAPPPPPPPPPLSRAKTSSCALMSLASLALRVALISSHAFGEVGLEPAMSRPDSPRGLRRGDDGEEVAEARIVRLLLRRALAGLADDERRSGLPVAAATGPLLSLPGP